MVSERQGLAARFVTVCAQYGEVTETGGLRRFRMPEPCRPDASCRFPCSGPPAV